MNIIPPTTKKERMKEKKKKTLGEEELKSRTKFEDKSLQVFFSFYLICTNLKDG